MAACTFRSYGFQGFSEAVVVDVETTGLNPEVDRVVSVAAIRVNIEALCRAGRLDVDPFHAQINPGIPIPTAASRIHGIRDEHVADAKHFHELAASLRAYIGDLPLIGHNIQFDKKFLQSEFKRASVKGLGRTKSFCTLNRMKEHLGYTGRGFRRVSLDESLNLAGISGRTGEYHEALEDARLTLQLAAFFYSADSKVPIGERREAGPAERVARSAGFDASHTRSQWHEGSRLDRFFFWVGLAGIIGLVLYWIF